VRVLNPFNDTDYNLNIDLNSSDYDLSIDDNIDSSGNEDFGLDTDSSNLLPGYLACNIDAAILYCNLTDIYCGFCRKFLHVF